MDDAPRIRAGHDERDRTTDHLAQAFAEGKLTHEEFEERSGKVLASRYLDELAPLVADLTPSTGAPVPAHETASGLATRFDPTADASHASVAVFSSKARVGPWVVGPQHINVAVFGATSLDLRELVHTTREVVISAWAVMGGTEIIVSPDTEVVVDGFALLGGFGWMDQAHARPPKNPTGPRVRVRGFAFCGAVGVTRKPLELAGDVTTS